MSSLTPSTERAFNIEIGDAGLDPEDFKAAFRMHPAGIAVVTADDGNGPVAMTVSSLFSVSAVPALLVFSASALSSSTATIRAAQTLVVHMLTAKDLGLAQLCASRGVDRFAAGHAWSRLESGEPQFHGVSTRLRGRVVNQLEAGASALIVVEVLDVLGGDTEADARPLVYHDRTWHALGDETAIEPR